MNEKKGTVYSVPLEEERAVWLTKREYAAIQIMAGLSAAIVEAPEAQVDDDVLAADSVKATDALLAELAKEKM